MRSVAETASAVISESLDALVADALVRQFALWPRLETSFSALQRRRMKEDTRYHLEFIASSLWFQEPALIDDYAIWCKTLFTNLSLPIEWLEGALSCIGDTLGAALPAQQAEAAEGFVERAMRTLLTATTESSSFLEPGSPLGELAREYLLAILAGHRVQAEQLIDDAVAAGSSVRDIYLGVFQPTQREMGRLWLLNEVTVAQEHYVTAVTQVAMAKLRSRSEITATTDRTLVAASVGSELHDLGIRMIADVFELNGWNTRYLGANTPKDAVLHAVRDSHADTLALSATIASHVTQIAEIIESLRADEATADVKVLVGGYPFNIAPGLWLRVGADGYAPDAETAPEIAARLHAAGSSPGVSPLRT